LMAVAFAPEIAADTRISPSRDSPPRT
jgi:hypothetical protein